MDFLPTQIIEDILALPILSIKDVLNFSSTSHHYRELIINNNYFWKQKYHTECPQFIELFSNDFHEWFEEVRYIYELNKRTHNMVSNMSPKFYLKKELSDSDLTEWVCLCNESPRAYKYIAYDLLSSISTPIETSQVVPANTDGNHTFQYYAIKVLRFIRQEHMAQEWENWIPELEQTLEKGAVFVAEWFQLDWYLEHIYEILDDFSDQVKTHLKSMYPNHPLHTVPPEILQKWKKKNLEINYWNATESQQIIQSLMIVFYEDLHFCGNNDLRDLPYNSFINKVLLIRQGRPLILSIIYESIARRLGLKYQLIGFPNYFLLKFTINPSNYYYLDVFMMGTIIPKGACPYSNQLMIPKNHLVPISTRQLIGCLANDLYEFYEEHTHTDKKTDICSALQLLHLLTPMDITVLTNLTRLYVTHGMDTTTLEELVISQIENGEDIEQLYPILQNLENSEYKENDDSIAEIIPKHRTENMLYAVGMIMKHVRANYICVIYDWDPICTATDQWEYQRGVYKLRYKNHQPFYKVLLENNVHDYVAQENLVPTTSTNILCVAEDLGRHFSHCFEHQFIPNAEKENEFPEDAAVRQSYRQKMKPSDIDTV